jgi:DNA repair exonuclease SbcCD ATPase subunit
VEGNLGEETRTKLNQYVARLDHVEKQVKDESEQLSQALIHVENVGDAQTIIQSVAEQIQTIAHRRVSSIVTRCLHAVFGKDSYDFKINFRKLRGKTEAELKLTKGGLELDPMDSTGGGVVDVVSFALRLAGIIMTRPSKRRLLVLDEPLKHLSRSYSERAKIMLETLAEELNFQIVLISHNPRLKMGKEVVLE